mmetsp:Transcript_17673/g.26394  ORF Transcript_17673/g.26394 Transcript_17673/m.26394 type:complete len:272 (+) Transcript_17673:200-1015(+)
MWLLDVVVSDEKNLSESHDAIFQLVTAFNALILAESLLLHNDHLINSPIKRFSGSSLCSNSNRKIHLVLLRLGDVNGIDGCLRCTKDILSLLPDRCEVFIQGHAFGRSFNSEILLQALFAFLRRNTINDMQESGKEVVLRGITFLEYIGLVVTVVEIKLLQDRTEMNCFRNHVSELPHHGENIMVHRQTKVGVDISKAFNDLSGHIAVIIRFLAFTELLKGCFGHHSHCLFGYRGETFLRTLHFPNSIRKCRYTVIVIVDVMIQIVGIVGL